MKLKSILTLATACLLFALTSGIASAEDTPPDQPKPNAEHRAEGEQLLGAMRDMARVHYAKNGTAPETLTGDKGTRAKPEDLKGKHFSVTDKVYVVGEKGQKAALTAEPVKASDGYCIVIFSWANGGNDYHWYDTFEALKEAHEDVEFGGDEDNSGNAGKDDAFALYRKKGTMWMTKNVIKIAGMEDMISYSKTEITEETIKVEAGEFECIVTETGGNKVWSSKTHPGLLVKMTHASGSAELVEFKEG
jgi:hypothetical protein